MEKIPTAEEFVNQYDWENSTLDIPSVLIEFAKLHVEAALEAASEKANLYLHNPGWKHSSDIKTVKCHNYDASINRDSILNAYPLTNIK